ncbi:MAG: flagellar motor protein MotD [Gammaproteobacteria bacterium]|nr:flagellar motor protein MotD [Gammaproteobacteria bacterium]
MARKKKPEEHENHERWLVSYADFITLLFAFFVVMYSISSVNEGKYRVLSEALTAAFRNPNKSLEPIQVGAFSKSPQDISYDLRKSPYAIKPPPEFPVPDVLMDSPDETGKFKPSKRAPKLASDGAKGDGKLKGAQALKEISDRIERALAGLIAEKLIEVRRDQFWMEVEIKSSILFSSGVATLQPEARGILKSLANILNQFPNPIHVEGFTDSVPISTSEFRSNWELSAARAATVVHLFMKQHVDPRRMAAIGYGEFQPIDSNDTPQGRSNNRRVVLVVLAGVDVRQMLTDEQKEKQIAQATAADPVTAPVAAAEADAQSDAGHGTAKVAAVAEEGRAPARPDPVPEMPLATPPAIPGEPTDVTYKEKTDRGVFPVIDMPFETAAPIDLRQPDLSGGREEQ